MGKVLCVFLLMIFNRVRRISRCRHHARDKSNSVRDDRVGTGAPLFG